MIRLFARIARSGDPAHATQVIAPNSGVLPIERDSLARFFALIAVALTAVTLSYADVSYRVTRKVSGGKLAQTNLAALNLSQDSSYYMKGKKVAVVDEFSTDVLDFEAQISTRIYKTTKHYHVTRLRGLDTSANADTQIKAEAKQTGQKKILGGNDAAELLMSIEVPNPRNPGSGAMKMEIDMWLSHSVPGADELRSFYKKNGVDFPWRAIGRISPGIPMLLPSGLEAFALCFDYGSGCAADRGIQSAVASTQRSIGAIVGIPVEQVIRVTSPSDPFWSAFLRGAADAPGPLIEITMDATGFSTDPIPDSLFAIPNGYTEGQDIVAPPAGPWNPPPLKDPVPVTAGRGSTVTSAVYRVGNGVKAPTLISKIAPEYSEEARAANINGSVLLSLVVDTNGVPRDIRVLKGLGMGLDEKAADAVAKWKFRPGMKDGVPVNVLAQVEVNFRMADPAPVK